MKLNGRYAIITGASQGLGAAITEQYIAEGASVLLCARTTTDLISLQARLSPKLSANQKILIKTTDVSKPNDIDELMAFGLNTFPKIDILVNNAGIYGPLGVIEEIPWEEWIQAIQINLLGAVYACRAIVPHFKQRGYGKIVTLSGGGATNPLPRISAYAASKAALVRFVETLALEVKEYNIDINAIAPGVLATRMTDTLLQAGPEKVGADFHAKIRKHSETGGTPLEVGAKLAVYLGSAASDGISGKLIAAAWDPWEDLHQHRTDLETTDIYTLRRILPSDRNKTWGNNE